MSTADACVDRTRNLVCPTAIQTPQTTGSSSWTSEFSTLVKKQMKMPIWRRTRLVEVGMCAQSMHLPPAHETADLWHISVRDVCVFGFVFDIAYVLKNGEKSDFQYWAPKQENDLQCWAPKHSPEPAAQGEYHLCSPKVDCLLRFCDITYLLRIWEKLCCILSHVRFRLRMVSQT